jgi:hypothetical protein
LPLEIYQLILQDLSRDDIKALRMSCKEIELRISQILFETVVVPFNAEIYGMLVQNVMAQENASIINNGQVKFNNPQLPPAGGLVWKNLGHSDVYNGHGLDMFKGFGRFIRKYGMSFEADEGM